MKVLLQEYFLGQDIESGKDRIESLSSSWITAWEKRLIPKLPTEFWKFALVVFLVTISIGMVIGGWLQSISGLLWSGVSLLCIMLLAVLLNKETRDEQIPQGTRRWLYPLYILWLSFLLCVAIPVFLLPVVLLQIGLKIISFIVQCLASINILKWVFLVSGTIMIFIGLILEYIDAP